MRHVVAIAEISERDFAQVAAMFLQCEIVCQCLAGMFEITEAVDHRDARILRHLRHCIVPEGAEHNGIYPTLKVMRHVGNTLPGADVRLRLVEEERCPPHGLHARLECQARTQTRFLEEQNNLFSSQSLPVVAWPCLDGSCEFKQRSHGIWREVGYCQ